MPIRQPIGSDILSLSWRAGRAEVGQFDEPQQSTCSEIWPASYAGTEKDAVPDSFAVQFESGRTIEIPWHSVVDVVYEKYSA